MARVLFIGLWPLLLHLIPIIILYTPADYYLAFPFGVVFHAMLIQLMFAYKTEWKAFTFFMALNLLGMLFTPTILIVFDTDHDIPEMINYKYYFYDVILYWLLFNLVTFYVLNVIEAYIKKINDSKTLIENQKEELNAMNQNLELIVSQRTNELEE